VPEQYSAHLPEQQCKYGLGIGFQRMLMDPHQSELQTLTLSSV